MLLKEYNLLDSYIKNEELNKLALKLQKSEQETAQCLFYTKNDNDIYMDSFYRSYRRSDFTIYPIENYKMTFSGDGRMVTLERTDYVLTRLL